MSHVDVALELLPERDRKTVFQALVSALVRPLDTLDLAAQGMAAWRDLANASGDALDVLGRILKVRRNALSDEEYLGALRVQQMVLRSDGLPDTLLRIAELCVGGAVVSKLLETPPASAFLYVYTPTLQQRPLHKAIGKARLGGVAIHVVTCAASSASRWGSVWGGDGAGFGLGSVWTTTPTHMWGTVKVANG